MFPSPEYIQECIENADRLREEWEPRVGDYYTKKQRYLILGWGVETWTKGYSSVFKGEYVWLPRLDQLIRMLEERGYRGSMWFDIATELSDGQKGPYSVKIFHKDRVVHYPLREGEAIFEILTVGPDPATALLRAWLEVVEDEKENSEN